MILPFSSAQKQLGVIKHLRDWAREPWSSQEVNDRELVRLDRAHARIAEHAKRADQAYRDFATLPRVA